MKKTKILLIGSLPPPFHGQSIAFKSAADCLQDYDIKIIESSFRSTFFLNSIIKIFFFYIRIPFIFTTYRPTKVYFLCSRSMIGGVRDIYLMLFTYISSAKFYNHLHGSDLSEFIYSLSPTFRKIFTKLYQRIDGHAVLINGMQKELEFINRPEKVKVIPNFCLENSSLDSIKRDPKENKIQIVYLSSINKTKGIFDLITATDLLHENGLNINLVVAGGFMGDNEIDATEVEKRFYNLVANKKYIKYIGLVGSEEKFKLLGKSHIFALPSYYKSEAVPLSIIEAMRMGCYIITTDYKYLPSLVKNGINGAIVKIQTPSDIVNVIENLLSNPEILNETAVHNKSEAIKKYSETKYHKNILDFLNLSQ